MPLRWWRGTRFGRGNGSEPRHMRAFRAPWLPEPDPSFLASAFLSGLRKAWRCLHGPVRPATGPRRRSVEAASRRGQSWHPRHSHGVPIRATRRCRHTEVCQSRALPNRGPVLHEARASHRVPPGKADTWAPLTPCRSVFVVVVIVVDVVVDVALPLRIDNNIDYDIEGLFSAPSSSSELGSPRFLR